MSSLNNYAIVPEKIQLLKKIQNTNDKLTNINQQINSLIENSKILYKNAKLYFLRNITNLVRTGYIFVGLFLVYSMFPLSTN